MNDHTAIDIGQLRWKMRNLAIFACLLPGVVDVRAQCVLPRYKLTGTPPESDFRDVITTISMPVQDFTPSKLLCLANALRARYGDRRDIIVSIFSSRKAAERSLGILGPETEDVDIEWLRSLHARFVYWSAKQEGYITLIPAPTMAKRMMEGPFDTRIWIPATEVPRCKVEVAGRCVLALHECEYPYDALRSGAGGRVTLNVVFSREGKPRRERVAGSTVPLDQEAALLQKAAIQNLRTWRLEPAERESEVQITYTYRVDRSLTYLDRGFRWIANDEIEIWSGPIR